MRRWPTLLIFVSTAITTQNKFPKSILASTKFISTAKLYVRGVDLLCLDHIKKADPEQYGADYPLNRSLVVGLALGF